MKIWKALGLAALAAVVPVRFKKDEETGKKTFQSLLWKLDVGPAADGPGTEIGLDLTDGIVTGPILNAAAKKEAALFADDDPEAALIEMDEAELDATIAAEFEAEAEADKAALDAFAEAEVDEAELDAIIAEEFGPEVSEAELDAMIAAEFEADQAAPDAAETIETEE